MTLKHAQDAFYFAIHSKQQSTKPIWPQSVLIKDLALHLKDTVSV